VNDRGECDTKSAVEEEAKRRKEPMVISVCEPVMLSDTIRKVVRGMGGSVDFMDGGQSY